jgi:hypothetical protein
MDGIFADDRRLSRREATMRRILLSTTAVATIAVTLALAAVPARAHAPVNKTQSFSISVGPSPGDWGIDHPNQQLDIPLFDSSSGTLKSLLVFEKLTANYSGNVHFSSSPSSASPTGTLHADTSLGISGGPASLNGPAVLTAGGLENVSFTGTAATAYSFGGSDSLGPMMVADLSDWEQAGGGTLIAQLTTETLTQSPPGVEDEGGHGFTASPVVDFTLTGVFHFSTTAGPVPEPASALMLGAGVLALGAARRRQRRKG